MYVAATVPNRLGLVAEPPRGVPIWAALAVVGVAVAIFVGTLRPR